jgi:hypothetical protein
MLISALLEAKWIDSDSTYRLIVHDWHEHCEDFVKKRLARLKLPFLSIHGDKDKVTGHWEENGRRAADSVRKTAAVVQPRACAVPCQSHAKAMPEPKPTPEPEPRPESEPSQDSVSELEHTHSEADSKSSEPEVYREIEEPCDAYESLSRCLRTTRGYKKPHGKLAEQMEADLSGIVLRESSVRRIVDEFVEWAETKEKPPGIDKITRSPWREKFEDAASLDQDFAMVMATATVDVDTTRLRMVERQQSSFPKSEAPPPLPLPPLAERWNAIAPDHLKVSVWSTVGKDHANLMAACRDPTFINSVDKNLEWCQATWQAAREDSYVTFSWFIKPGVCTEIVNHKHDRLLKRDKSDPPKPDGFDMDSGLER